MRLVEPILKTYQEQQHLLCDKVFSCPCNAVSYERGTPVMLFPLSEAPL
jgi:hypothetical protein